MNPKLKILIGISVIVVIFIGWRFIVAPKLFLERANCSGKPNGTSCDSGLWLDIFGRVCGGRSCGGLGMGVCLHNECVPGGRAITTDKGEYKRGETVKITVGNGLGNSVWYFGGCGSPRFWGLKKLEDGEWKGINFFLPDLVEEEEVCDPKLCERRAPIELKLHSVIKHDWRGSICERPAESTIGLPEIDPEFIGKGTYRVSFTYGLSKDEEGFGLLEAKTIYSSEFTISGTLASANCNLFEMPMTEEEIEGCTCPEGYEKFPRLSGAYCATNSQKPCSAHADCPKGEHCISSDGKSWFCTGQFAGCAFRDPENPEEQICAD